MKNNNNTMKRKQRLTFNKELALFLKEKDIEFSITLDFKEINLRCTENELFELGVEFAKHIQITEYLTGLGKEVDKF